MWPQTNTIHSVNCESHAHWTHTSYPVLYVGLLNEVWICELQISSLNLYSFFSPSIFESKHH